MIVTENEKKLNSLKPFDQRTDILSIVVRNGIAHTVHISDTMDTTYHDFLYGYMLIFECDWFLFEDIGWIE